MENKKKSLLKTVGSIFWLAFKIIIIIYVLYNAVSVSVLYQGF